MAATASKGKLRKILGDQMAFQMSYTGTCKQQDIWRTEIGRGSNPSHFNFVFHFSPGVTIKAGKSGYHEKWLLLQDLTDLR